MGTYYRLRMDSRDLNYKAYFSEGEHATVHHDDYHSHNTERLDLEGGEDPTAVAAQSRGGAGRMEGARMKIVITNANGLTGWHAAVGVHAANCAARFRGAETPHELVLLDHAAFEDDAKLDAALGRAGGLLHFAGVNRAPDVAVAGANPAIARRLAKVCTRTGSHPQVVYANSTYAASDTFYCRSKRITGEILAGIRGRYSYLVLQHIFGEGARPYYNNVTSTSIEAIIASQTLEINPAGRVSLLHADEAAQVAITEVRTGTIRPATRDIAVTELFGLLREASRLQGECLSRSGRCLHNGAVQRLSRGALPRRITAFIEAQHRCPRDAVRGSDSHPQGAGRRGLGIPVSGSALAPVGISTLHTHSIENVGQSELLTLFWAHDLFYHANPDTFADKVLK